MDTFDKMIVLVYFLIVINVIGLAIASLDTPSDTCDQEIAYLTLKELRECGAIIVPIGETK